MVKNFEVGVLDIENALLCLGVCQSVDCAAQIQKVVKNCDDLLVEIKKKVK